MGEIEVTEPPIIRSRNVIPTWIWRQQGNQDQQAARSPLSEAAWKGTAVAVIDSGIDYQNEVFRNAGGSRIAYLWDQSIEEEEQNQSGRELEAENGDADNLPGMI